MPRLTALSGETMGHLTTHILDSASGRPAANVGIRLYAVGEDRILRTSAVSNPGDRTDAPLLDGDAMQTGSYQHEFDIGDYFAATGFETSTPAFLSTVVIRFAVIAAENEFGEHEVPARVIGAARAVTLC